MSTSFAPIAFPLIGSAGTDDLADFTEQARTQGHAAGYAAGRRAATETLAADRAAQRDEHDRALAAEIAEVRGALNAVVAAASQLAASTHQALAVADEAVLRTAVEIASMIVGRELLDVQHSAIDAVRRALAGAAELPLRDIRLHPADALIVAEAGASDGIQIVADPTLQRGDAIADLLDGLVDARVSTALERVRRALAGGDE
jgi:flagellar assembly protein FliH